MEPPYQRKSPGYCYSRKLFNFCFFFLLKLSLTILNYLSLDKTSLAHYHHFVITAAVPGKCYQSCNEKKNQKYITAVISNERKLILNHLHFIFLMISEESFWGGPCFQKRQKNKKKKNRKTDKKQLRNNLGQKN